MGSRQGHQNRIPPEIAVNFRELFPEHEDFDDVLQDQETVYQSLKAIGKHDKGPVPIGHHISNSRNLSVDNSSISRTDSMDSDVDVALTLSMLELDTQSGLTNVSISESSRSATGNRGSRNTETSLAAFDHDDIDPDNMTYEELQSLGDAIGIESRGLSEKVISRLPSRKFKGKSGWFSSKSKSQPQECVICSEEYASGELLTTLQCKHRYHKYCIGKWFSSNKVTTNC
uniref:RING-type domain-containing protein n=1 Tax=Kalanchoe fedtschenkoi TaxID=63787 RepID=A0A7N0V164_KALFE